MYLDRKHKCSSHALFDVPHKNKPMTAKRIMRKFPEFAEEMDGVTEDRCLLYFWKRNKETKVYEFLDEEAEEEIAELWGVEVYDEQKEEEKERAKRRPLTEEEIRTFKEELRRASEELRTFFTNNATKSLEELQHLQDLQESDSSDSSHTIP